MSETATWVDKEPPRARGQTGFIYLLTNTVNGKQYVGQTMNTIARRWSGHVSNVNIHQQPIAAAIRKYGAKNFTVEKLCRLDSRNLREHMDAIERYLIKYHNTLVPNGYNLHTGGRGGPLSDGHKEKLRRAHLGKKASPETRAKMSAVRKGRKMPEGFALAASLRQRGIKRGPGKPISDQQKAQISAVHKGKVLSPETRAKVSAALRGRVQSAETIAKRMASIAAMRERKKLEQQNSSPDSQS